MSATGPRQALLAKVLVYFASQGVGDTSLRTLAAGVGTSHRMLIYHFGSREGLLTAVVDAMCHRQLAEVGSYLRAPADADPVEVAWSTWHRLADDAAVFAPLFFELSAHAMVGQEWAAQLRDLVEESTGILRRYFEQLGHPTEHAHLLATSAMALSRGAVFDLALTGDRQAADDVIRRFLDKTLVPSFPRMDQWVLRLSELGPSHAGGPSGSELVAETRAQDDELTGR